jgi:hypothetical protein
MDKFIQIISTYKEDNSFNYTKIININSIKQVKLYVDIDVKSKEKMYKIFIDFYTDNSYVFDNYDFTKFTELESFLNDNQPGIFCFVTESFF